MIAAFMSGILGLSLSLGLGMGRLALTGPEVIGALLVSNLAGLLSLILTLQAEQVPWIQKYFLNRTLKTWTLLATIYFGILLGALPYLRSIHVLVILAFPLILSTGFCLFFFGPIQDALVSQKQRKIRTTKNDFPCFPTDSAML